MSRITEIIRGDTWAVTLQAHSNPIAIKSSTNATPIVLTTNEPHQFVNTDKLYIYGHQINKTANGNHVSGAVTNTTITLTGVVGIGIGNNSGFVGKAEDGTGYTVTCKIKESHDSDTAIATPTFAWVDESLFRFTLTLTATQTAAITQKSLVYSIQKNLAGVKTTIDSGEISIRNAAANT